MVPIGATSEELKSLYQIQMNTTHNEQKLKISATMDALELDPDACIIAVELNDSRRGSNCESIASNHSGSARTDILYANDSMSCRDKFNFEDEDLFLNIS